MNCTATWQPWSRWLKCPNCWQPRVYRYFNGQLDSTGARSGPEHIGWGRPEPEIDDPLRTHCSRHSATTGDHLTNPRLCSLRHVRVSWAPVAKMELSHPPPDPPRSFNLSFSIFLLKKMCVYSGPWDSCCSPGKRLSRLRACFCFPGISRFALFSPRIGRILIYLFVIFLVADSFSDQILLFFEKISDF